MNHAVLLERRLQRGHLLHRGAAPDALVLQDDIAVLVLDAHDLVVECAGILCGRGLFVRRQGEFVERGAVEAPLLGDHLRTDALVRDLALVAVQEGLGVGPPAVGQRRAHRGARHRLDAAGDDDVVVPGDHARRREVDGLLARPALPVDGHARHGLGPAGGQQRGAADVEGLFAGLHDAAPDDVVDDARVDAGLVDQAVEHLRGKLGRMHPRQPAVALADR
ncbi:hypothetical protein MOKP118_11840 [Mycobacterium avium subsp. hominissuis]